jgi:hypothetical protein
MRFGRALSRLILAVGAASPALAGADTPESNGPFEIVMLQAAPGVIHFDPDFDHAKHSWMVGIEWQRPSRWLAGFTYFNNSFDQKSQYIYGGKVWSQRDSGQGWYFKLTAGVILGYEEPYEDKIPYNHNGVAPGIVPALGYKVDRASMQFNLLGTAGLMITFGYDAFRWK